MNRTLKNILIAVLVPSALAAVYFGYKFYTRKQKEKKVLEEVDKQLSKNKTQLAGLNEQVISQWKKSLSQLKADDFDAFFNYFVVTIPYGKVTMIDDKNVTKTTWIYESTNPVEFAAVAEKGIKAMAGKDIEKLFQAITPTK